MILTLCFLIVGYGCAMEGYSTCAFLISLCCILFNVNHESINRLYAYRYPLSIVIAVVFFILSKDAVSQRFLPIGIANSMIAFLLMDQIEIHLIPHLKHYARFVMGLMLLVVFADDLVFEKWFLVQMIGMVTGLLVLPHACVCLSLEKKRVVISLVMKKYMLRD